MYELELARYACSSTVARAHASTNYQIMAIACEDGCRRFRLDSIAKTRGAVTIQKPKPAFKIHTQFDLTSTAKDATLKIC